LLYLYIIMILKRKKNLISITISSIILIKSNFKNTTLQSKINGSNGRFNFKTIVLVVSFMQKFIVYSIMCCFDEANTFVLKLFFKTYTSLVQNIDMHSSDFRLQILTAFIIKLYVMCGGNWNFNIITFINHYLSSSVCRGIISMY